MKTIPITNLHQRNILLFIVLWCLYRLYMLHCLEGCPKLQPFKAILECDMLFHIMPFTYKTFFFCNFVILLSRHGKHIFNFDKFSIKWRAERLQHWISWYFFKEKNHFFVLHLLPTTFDKIKNNFFSLFTMKQKKSYGEKIDKKAFLNPNILIWHSYIYLV